MLTPKEKGGGNTPVYPVAIEHSALFDGVEDYLHYTPGADGDRRTFTLHASVRRTRENDGAYLLYAGTDADNYFYIIIGGDNKILVKNQTSNVNDWAVRTDSLHFDPTAHLHLTVAVDTTQAVASDRVKIWVNGVQPPLTNESYPAQNFQTFANSQVVHQIARYVSYPAELQVSNFHFVAGQYLAETDFGQHSRAIPRLWVAKKYSGTYGSHGFHLDFADAADLGKDVSGNGNHLATVGEPAQSLDTPTKTYCTLNPLYPSVGGSYAQPDFSENNLRWDNNGNYHQVRSTWAVPGDENWYFEVEVMDAYAPSAGTTSTSLTLSDGIYGCGLKATGETLQFGGSWSGTVDLAAFTPGMVIGFAWDGTTNELTLDDGTNSYTISNTYTPETIRIASYSPSTAGVDAYRYNFGATGFTHTKPEGYKTLCTEDLAEPVVLDSRKYADIVLRDGTGTAASVNLPDMDGGPDFVNIKKRNLADSWGMFDILRGDDAYLKTNTSDANTTLVDSLALDASGYDLGSYSFINGSGDSFVDLVLKADPESGFAQTLVTNFQDGQTVNCDLNNPAKLIIMKNLSKLSDWHVWHDALPSKYGYLNKTDAFFTAPAIFQNIITGSFTANNLSSWNGDDVMFYCFTDSDIFTVFGYTGNGLTDGPYVDCNGRPLCVLFAKNTSDGTQNWYMADAVRNPHNSISQYLRMDATNAEVTSGAYDFTATGIKLNTGAYSFNRDGDFYVGLAIKELATKYANAF